MAGGGYEVASGYVSLYARMEGAQTRQAIEGAINKSMPSIGKSAGELLGTSMAASVGNALSQLGGATATTGKWLTGIGALGVMAGKKLAGSLIDTISGAETTSIAFRTLFGSADMAATAMSRLNEFAIATPYEFANISKSASKLVAMGYDLDSVIDSSGSGLLEYMGNWSAALGLTDRGFENVLTQMGHIKTTGHLYTRQMTALTNNGLAAWEALHKYYKEVQGVDKSIEQLREDTTKGMISSEEAIEALTWYAKNNFGGAMEEMSMTWSGVMSNLNDAIKVPLMSLKDTSAYKDMTRALYDLMDPLRELFEAGLPAIEGAFGKVEDALRGALPMVRSFADELKRVDGEEVANALQAIATVFGSGPALIGLGAAEQALGGFVTAASSTATQLGGSVASKFSHAGSRIVEGFKRSMAKSEVVQAFEGFTLLPKAFPGQMKLMGNKLGRMFKEDIKEQIVGLDDAMSLLREQFKSMGEIKPEDNKAYADLLKDYFNERAQLTRRMASHNFLGNTLTQTAKDNYKAIVDTFNYPFERAATQLSKSHLGKDLAQMFPDAASKAETGVRKAGIRFAHAVAHVASGSDKTFGQLEEIYKTRAHDAAYNMSYALSKMTSPVTSRIKAVGTKLSAANDSLVTKLSAANDGFRTFASDLKAVGDEQATIAREALVDPLSRLGGKVKTAVSRVTAPLSGSFTRATAGLKSELSSMSMTLGAFYKTKLEPVTQSLGARISSTAQTLKTRLSSMAKTVSTGLYKALLDPFVQLGHGAMERVITPLASKVTSGATAISTGFSQAMSQMASSVKATRLSDILAGVTTKLSPLNAALQRFSPLVNLAGTAAKKGLGAGMTVAAKGMQAGLTAFAAFSSALLKGSVVFGGIALAATAMAGVFASTGGDLTQLGHTIQTTLANAGTVAANFVNGLTESLSSLVASGGINSFFEGLTTGLDQLINQLGPALETLGPVLMTAFGQVVNNIASMLGTYAPMIANGALAMFGGLLQGLGMVVQAITPQLPAIITGIATAIAQNAPTIVSAGVQLFTSLVTAFATALPVIIEQLPAIVSAIGAALAANGPQLLAAGQTLFQAIADAIPIVVPMVINGLIGMLTQAVQTLPQWLPQFLGGAAEMFGGILQGLLQAVPGILAGLANLIMQCIMQLPAALGAMISAALTLFLGIATGVAQAAGEILNAVGETIQSAIDHVGDFIGDCVTAGGNIIQGFVDGVVGMAHALVDAVGNAISSAISFAQGLLKINSPSKVFRSMGYSVIEGFVQGIDRRAYQTLDSMGRMVGGVIAATDPLGSIPLGFDTAGGAMGSWSTSAPAMGGSVGGTVVNQNFNTTVVREDDDLYVAAPIIYRNAMREAGRVIL